MLTTCRSNANRRKKSLRKGGGNHFAVMDNPPQREGCRSANERVADESGLMQLRLVAG
jgi:hypothetical protein